MGELHALGVRIFTDDGACVADAGVMRRALEYATGLAGAVVAQHAEDAGLAGSGSMHEGAWSSRLGIPGPARRGRGGHRGPRHHARRAHRRAGRTSSTCRPRARSSWCAPPRPTGSRSPPRPRPHHFTLTDAACASYDPLFKVHPPLRTDADVEAVKAGLADGTIDAIATDHAPHPTEAKERPFEEAPPGMLGLETALALTLTELVEPGVLTLADALALLSWRPAAIAGVGDRHGRPDRAGRAREPLSCSTRRNAGRSTRPASPARPATRPYAGRKLTGRVRHTVLRGNPVVLDGEASGDDQGVCEGVLVLADGELFEGELIGADPSPDGERWGGRGDRRGGVQHRAVRLPGDRHRPVLRGPDHHLHLPAHRQLRRQRATTTRAAGRSAAA